MRVSVAVMVAVAVGCGGGAGGGAAVSRDSAGIRIVENSGPAWRAGESWKVVDSPLVDIGGRGGEAAYELDQVRGPVRLSDGRLALVNATTNEIRLFDARGKHLRSAGRAGSGPGEYRSIVGIWLGRGDSLLVGDVLLRRITVLDHDGNVGRSFSLGEQAGQLMPSDGRIQFALPLGWFADGSVAGVSQSLAINEKRSGVHRDTVAVIRYGPDGAVRDTLGRFPGVEMEQMTLTIGAQTVSAPTAVPLGKQTVSAVDKDRLLVAQNNAWEIEIRGADGTLRVLARSGEKPGKLTPSDIAAHRKQNLAEFEAQPMFRGIPAALKTQIQARVEQAKYPPTLPFFTLLFADPEGNVWAQEAAAPTRQEQRLVVVDSSGRWLGTVTMPPRFQPTFIGLDAIYGIWKDPDDVQHVRGYPLRKS